MADELHEWPNDAAFFAALRQSLRGARFHVASAGPADAPLSQRDIMLARDTILTGLQLREPLTELRRRLRNAEGLPD